VLLHFALESTLERMPGGASLPRRSPTHDARAVPFIGSTPDDTLLAALDSLLAQSDAWAVADGRVGCRGLAATCPAIGRRESEVRVFARQSEPSLAGLERILGPILAGRRRTRARGHSAGRSSDDYTLGTSSEEMADGDPQMAECLWRSALSRGPRRHGRCRRGAVRCLVLSGRAGQ
jgi:hypothetical protein